MATTDSIRGLAQELNVGQRLLYHWRDQFQPGGIEALRRLGRPSRRAPAAIEVPPAPIDLSDPAAARRRRGTIHAVIHAMLEQQGDHIGVERMCGLAGVNRAGYYWYWLASKPRQEETALRDATHLLSLERRENG
jgi:transposase-like protein